MRKTFAMAVLLVPAIAGAQETMQASGSMELSTEGDATAQGSGVWARAPGERGPLVLGAEVGAIFPQIATELGTHVALGIEAGWILPYFHRRLEALFTVGFAPPGTSFSDGPYDGEVRQQELHFSLGPRWRFMKLSKKWNVSAALGFRLFLLQTYSNGSARGEDFAEFREQSTQPGFFVAVGGEYRLGPGAILLDVDFGTSSLPHEITGDVSTTNIAATLGYRFFLL